MDLEKHRNKNGTINGVSALSEFTGLGQGEVQAIFQQVKANNAKLEACQYHEFELHEQGPVFSRWKYRCVHCGGVINGSDYRWHEIGRRPKP